MQVIVPRKKSYLSSPLFVGHGIVGKQAEGCFSHDFGWPKPKQPTWLGKVFSSVRYNVHLGVKRHFQLKDFKTNTSVRKSNINKIFSSRIQKIWSPLN